MPGDGIKMAITKSSLRPPARILDVTRLVSRAGRVPTGIDRVERAYVEALSQDTIPCFGLVRTAFGFLILSPQHLEYVKQLASDEQQAEPDLLSRFSQTSSRAAQKVESQLRRLSIARTPRWLLARTLARTLPTGFSYVNVGHSNLTPHVFTAVRAAGGRSTVLVHDIIPVEFPEFQRPKSAAGFEAKMLAVREGADAILYPSKDTKKRAEAYFSAFGTYPEGVAALLGVPPIDDRDLIASGTHLPAQPYFVALGTLEPRKNIGFLLDLWTRLEAPVPRLVLCGARGWLNEDVFARLDDLPKHSPICEVGALPDKDRNALLAGAAGLLCPSVAEGFGLPVVEALQLGIPVICAPLAVYEETLGPNAIAISLNDPNLWAKRIMDLASSDTQLHTRFPADRLTWESHFKTVLTLI